MAKTWYYNAKPAEIGTVRTWSDGQQHKKTSEGWVPMTRGRTKIEKQDRNDKYRGHLEPESGDDSFDEEYARKIIKEDFNNNISNAEINNIIQSFQDYTTGDYININKASRNEPVDEKYKKDFDNIERYLKQAPKFKGKIYRSIEVNKDFFNSIVDDERDKVNFRGLSSWTDDEVAADNMIDQLPKSAKIIEFVIGDSNNTTSVTHLSNTPYERETLGLNLGEYKIKNWYEMGEYEDVRDEEGNFIPNFIRVILEK
jgi:hypothetical protein